MEKQKTCIWCKKIIRDNHPSVNNFVTKKIEYQSITGKKIKHICPGCQDLQARGINLSKYFKKQEILSIKA